MANLSQLISDAAARYGVPASIALRVAQIESGTKQYDASGDLVRSARGALGVMQLLPSTAAQFGVDPTDVAQNIDGGVRYLQQLYGRYGDWGLAAAAYNWGPGNVDGYLRGDRSLPSSVAAYATNVSGASVPTTSQRPIVATSSTAEISPAIASNYVPYAPAAMPASTSKGWIYAAIGAAGIGLALLLAD